MGKIDELRNKLGLPPSTLQAKNGSERKGTNFPHSNNPSPIAKFPSLVRSILQEENDFYKSREKASPLFLSLANLDLQIIDPLEFEKLTLTLFEAFGFSGKTTPVSGDHGIDIILANPDGKLFCVQCKRYGADQLISPKEIREFYGAMTYLQTNEGYFVTTSSFTNQCIEFAQRLPLHLIDKRVFSHLLISAESIYREKEDHAQLSPEILINKYLSTDTI